MVWQQVLPGSGTGGPLGQSGTEGRPAMAEEDAPAGADLPARICSAERNLWIS